MSILVSAEKLCISYGKKTVIRDLSFTVYGGECLVLYGANGTGKSSILSALAGTVRHKGKLCINGTFAYVPQDDALFYDATVKENLEFFAALYKVKKPKEYAFGIDRYAKMRISELSGGMRKQLSIACAMEADPDVILLDEPTSSLDTDISRDLNGIISELKNRGKAVVMASHSPHDFFAVYDKILVIGNNTSVISRSEMPAFDKDEFAKAFYKRTDNKY